MRVLTWNLFHGRSVPPLDRDRFAEFADCLAGSEWDVALLQECPPWWTVPLGEACGASARMALTSRNQLFAVRRALGRRRPQTMRSGGGCNAILVRGGRIAEHRKLTLRRLPERRMAHAVRWEPAGVWILNLHAAANEVAWAQDDVAKAAVWLRVLAGDRPAVLGGDWNVRAPHAEGYVRAGGRGVDHVFVRGLRPDGVTETLERGTLSDHRPLRFTLADV